MRDEVALPYEAAAKVTKKTVESATPFKLAKEHPISEEPAVNITRTEEWPWRCREEVPLQRRYTYARLHGVTTQQYLTYLRYEQISETLWIPY